ncbi:hypothetical protein C4571_02540 [Candidatus Parcubacteria bacterium]|nr:MAG: hypothetical protein C4571_02540 [Candidatus Parcubacteria bacterium]
MALPQKVVEQLSRTSVQTPGWSGQLLMFSSTAFLLSLFIYLGLVYGYKPYLEKEVQKLDSQIQAFSQQISVEEQGEIINFYSQLVNVKSLLARHVVVSPFFDWLERHTQTSVYYTKLNLNTQSRQASLSGVARSVEDLAEQLQEFQNDPGVERVNFSNVSVGSNSLWQFDLTLFFKPAFFIPQTPK